MGKHKYNLYYMEEIEVLLRLDLTLCIIIVHFFVLQQRNEPKKMNQGCALGTPSVDLAKKARSGDIVQPNRDALWSNKTTKGLIVYLRGEAEL